MVPDREESYDVEAAPTPLRIQLLRFLVWPFAASMVALAAISILIPLYAYRDGKIVFVPALLIVGLCLVWLVENVWLSNRRVKKWCRSLAIPKHLRGQYFISDWTYHAWSFNSMARVTMVVLLAAVSTGVRGPWFVGFLMLGPVMYYASDAMKSWKKLRL
ncbi:MAG: hypothetical protein ABIO72_04345 [Patescibacteria group bacterium]